MFWCVVSLYIFTSCAVFCRALLTRQNIVLHIKHLIRDLLTKRENVRVLRARADLYSKQFLYCTSIGV